MTPLTAPIYWVIRSLTTPTPSPVKISLKGSCLDLHIILHYLETLYILNISVLGSNRGHARTFLKDLEKIRPSSILGESEYLITAVISPGVSWGRGDWWITRGLIWESFIRSSIYVSQQGLVPYHYRGGSTGRVQGCTAWAFPSLRWHAAFL